jgi:hypothetical protein
MIGALLVTHWAICYVAARDECNGRLRRALLWIIADLLMVGVAAWVDPLQR